MLKFLLRMFKVLAFLAVMSVATGNLSGEFVRESLKTQISLALKVSAILNKQVYVFDDTQTFTSAATVVIENIRVLRTSTGLNAVLSTAAQAVFNRYPQPRHVYTQFYSGTLVADTVGLAVKHD